MSTLILSSSDEVWSVPANAHSTVYGTNSAETLNVGAGASLQLVSFGAGDTLNIDGSLHDYSVRHSGATVFFRHNNGNEISIAAGTEAARINFSDIALDLTIVPGSGIMLGDQQLTSSATAITNPVPPEKITALDLATLDGNNGVRFTGEQADDFSGFQSRSAGDINGDGFDDLIISAPYNDENGDNSGKSYVVFGKAQGWDASVALGSLDGSNGFEVKGAESTWSGSYINGIGDFNNDGFDDLAIGASLNEELHIIYGQAENWAASIDLNNINSDSIPAITQVVGTGSSTTHISQGGDFNGDGYSDFLIGAPSARNGLDSSGSSWLLFGGSETPEILNLEFIDGIDGSLIPGRASGVQSGRSVSNAGDINGDGIDDILIGAPNAGTDNNWTGESYVVFGHTGAWDVRFDINSLDGSNGFLINGADETGQAGAAVSNAGDVNGDGYDDLLIGAPAASPDGVLSGGETWLLFGKADWNASVDLSNLNQQGSNDQGVVFEGKQAVGRAGAAISAAGDVNNDGYDDFLIAASAADSQLGEDRTGQVYLIYGREDWNPSIDLSHVNTNSGLTVDGIAIKDFLGSSVSEAGDVNNDGYDDFIISSHQVDGANDLQDSGESYLIFGNGGFYL